MKEIKTTNNYEMFKKLEGNRATSDRRVEKIKKSIIKVGYITSPILVNENMEIIDGQGRFEALKQLQLPIEYIVQNGINIRECVAMNVYQTNWTILDYIYSHADKGIQSFVYIRELMERFKINNVSIIAVATLGCGAFKAEHIHNGTLEITQEQYEKAIKKLEFFEDLYNGYNDMPRFRFIFKGLLHCSEIEEVDLERLKAKVIEVLEYKKIPPIPTIEEAMQFLEEIYNKNSKRPTLYIYTEYRKQVEERHAKAFRELNERKRMYKYLAEVEKAEEQD